MAIFKRVTPPADEPVALEETRAFLRVSGTEEDGLIARLLAGARERVEEATGRALMEQTWRMSADLGEGLSRGTFMAFRLRRPPYLSFVEARVARVDGTSVVIALDDVRVESDANMVWLRPGVAALAGARAWRPIEITWRAGYADAASVPDALKTAILLLTAEAYERQGSVGAPEAMAKVAAMLSAFRVRPI